MLVKQVVDAVRAQLGAAGIGEQRLILGKRRFSHPGGEYGVCIFAQWCAPLLASLSPLRMATLTLMISKSWPFFGIG